MKFKINDTVTANNLTGKIIRLKDNTAIVEGIQYIETANSIQGHRETMAQTFVKEINLDDLTLVSWSATIA